MYIVTYHLIPHSASAGETWMKSEVILSVECGTTELVHSTIALMRGPFEKLKMVEKRSPRMVSPSGIHKYTRMRKLVK